jgi:hypothetical protein
MLPETGYMYYTTQAWGVLQKSWKGYKIAKNQDDEKKMSYYAEGIRKAQKELGLEVDSFPNLGLYGMQDLTEHGSDTDVDEDRSHCDTLHTANELELSNTRNDDCYDYESEAQRRWRENGEIIR